MATLISYLASLPPDHTTVLVFLGALTPGFLMMLGGFAWAHGTHVRSGR